MCSTKPENLCLTDGRCAPHFHLSNIQMRVKIKIKQIACTKKNGNGFWSVECCVIYILSHKTWIKQTASGATDSARGSEIITSLMHDHDNFMCSKCKMSCCCCYFGGRDRETNAEFPFALIHQFACLGSSFGVCCTCVSLLEKLNWVE